MLTVNPLLVLKPLFTFLSYLKSWSLILVSFQVFYQSLVEVLIPDVLRPIPSKLLTDLYYIRHH